MGVILRQDVQRPLTAAELDANFEYLASNTVSREEIASINVTNSTYAQTASYFQGNADNANYATTAGHATIASTAEYVALVDNITGGKEGSLAIWSSTTTLTSSILAQTQEGISIQGAIDVRGDIITTGNASIDNQLTVPNIVTTALRSPTTLKLGSDIQTGTAVFVGTEGTNSTIDTTQLEVGLGEYARTVGDVSVVKLTGRLLHTTGSTSISFLNINPILEHRGLDYSGRIVGISYSPTQISIPRGTHIAFENTIGNNCFNIQGGSTTIGTADSEGYKLNISGPTKIASILNLVPISELPANATTGDIAMSGSAANAQLCYFNGSEWIAL